MNKPFAALLTAGLAASFAVVAMGEQGKPATPPPADKHVDAPKHDKDKREAKKEDKTTEKSPGMATIGKAAPDFMLKSTDGKDWRLSSAKGKIVVLEWCNPGCPVCQRVMSDGTVADALKTLKGMDVVYVAIDSTSGNPAEKTAKYLADNHIEIPALMDADGKVGHMYDAKTTPHCFVIDDKGILRYSGAIDDGGPNAKGKMNYVVNAVKQIKAGETVSPDTTKPYGCNVHFAKK